MASARVLSQTSLLPDSDPLSQCLRLCFLSSVFHQFSKLYLHFFFICFLNERAHLLCRKVVLFMFLCFGGIRRNVMTSRSLWKGCACSYYKKLSMHLLCSSGRMQANSIFMQMIQTYISMLLDHCNM